MDGIIRNYRLERCYIWFAWLLRGIVGIVNSSTRHNANQDPTFALVICERRELERTNPASNVIRNGH